MQPGFLKKKKGKSTPQKNKGKKVNGIYLDVHIRDTAKCNTILSELRCTFSDHGIVAPVVHLLVVRFRHSLAPNQTTQKNAAQPETRTKHGSDRS